MTGVGAKTSEQQIYDVRMLEEQRLDQMVPTKGEQAALGFLQSVREGRHTHPHGYDASFGIFYDRDQPHVYERKVSVDVLGDLPLVHFGITVQRGVCFVDYVENLGSPSSPAYFAGAFEFAYVKVIAFGAHFRHAEIFVHVCLTIAVGYAYLALHPVHFFRIPQTFHVCRVIRVVIRGGHRAQLVIAAGEHAFRVHIRKP